MIAVTQQKKTTKCLQEYSIKKFMVNGCFFVNFAGTNIPKHMMELTKGDKLIVTKDCFCQHYLHEKTNYPRPGLKELKLKEGDEVTFIENWGNFYGGYYRVEKDGEEYDILPENLKIKMARSASG